MSLYPERNYTHQMNLRVVNHGNYRRHREKLSLYPVVVHQELRASSNNEMLMKIIKTIISLTGKRKGYLSLPDA